MVMALGVAVCVVTGASRGFGLAVCREVAARVSPGSALLLVARSEEKLRLEVESLQESYTGLRVSCVAADLSTEDGLRRTMSAAGEMRSVKGTETLLVINNAGTLGDITKKFTDMWDMGEVNHHMSLNVSSALCLTSSMLRTFPRRPGLKRVVVNVSSLAAIKPFKCWTLYCACKAARDMMCRVLAEEEEDVWVLNYAPGPMDTDMMEQVRSCTVDLDIRMHFHKMKNEGALVDVEVSVRKMLDLIQNDTYKSGHHVDFYDAV